MTVEDHYDSDFDHDHDWVTITITIGIMIFVYSMVPLKITGSSARFMALEYCSKQ